MRGLLRPLTPSCVVGTASCATSTPYDAFLRHQRGPSAFSVDPAPSAPSERPQSGPMCPQHTSLRSQCNIMSNPSSPPRGIKVINSTIATHRPVDYSSPCVLLYSPAHSLHAVRCRQRSSRRPLPLPCRLLILPGIKVALYADVSTDADRVFPSASRPLTLASASRYIWEDVRLDPQPHLLSSLHGDLAPDLVGPLPPSAGYRYILSASTSTATTRRPTAWPNGHHQPHGRRPTQELVSGNHRKFYSSLPRH